jgi:hypothetical protein
MLAIGSRSVRHERIGGIGTCGIMAHGRATSPCSVPVDRIRSVTGEGRALAGGGPGVIDPYRARIRRIKINGQNGRVPRVKVAVHMRRIAAIVEMTVLAGFSGDRDVGHMLAIGSRSVR